MGFKLFYQQKKNTKMLNIFLELATEAGSVIRTIFKKGDYKTEIKDDNSPVTTADYKANELIVSGLKNNFPKIPVISEESKNENFDGNDFFLVDPLDGTKEFIKGSGQFSVNIAFIKKRKPFLGVIYRPMTGEIFFSDNEKNAYKYNNFTNSKKTLLKTNKNPNLISPIRVVTSKDHLDRETEVSLESIKKYETIKMGSSIKFCLLSEGSAEIYPRKMPTMEWDTAAGHAILFASGGNIIDLTTNEELIYGKRGYRNNSFVAYSSEKILSIFNGL